MTEVVPFEAEAHLDWLALTDALAEGHLRAKAKIGDTFLYRGKDTALIRSAWIDGLGLAVKTATIMPDNSALLLPAIHGGVSLYDDRTGVLDAVVDFHLVTKWKTAADSLLAARRLAPPDVRGILICGAGTVAASMVEAYSAAFPGARVALWNRTMERAEALAARTGVVLAGDLAGAVRAADIICTATMSSTPIIRGDWLRPGQHVDLIGAYRPDMREADDAVLSRGRLFVDSRETVLGHIGELQDPIDRGVITEEDIVADFYELDAFVRASDDLTIFKNGGGAHLDLMTSRYILDRWQSAPRASDR